MSQKSNFKLATQSLERFAESVKKLSKNPFLGLNTKVDVKNVKSLNCEILEEPKEPNKDTQQKLILDALKEGKEVSSYWGFHHGIIRLTNRVNELRDANWNIQDYWMKSASGKRFKVYYLETKKSNS